MEKFLNALEVKTVKEGVRYKKDSCGGDRIFVKKTVGDNLLEFVFHQGKWECHSKGNEVLSMISKLNSEEIKKPVNLSMDEKEYFNLYKEYSDIDEFGYFEKTSPDYVRVKDVLNSIETGSSVYDVGCNSGGIGRILKEEKHCDVSGSEINSALAKKARTKGVKVFNGWAEKVPYADYTFDYAILSFVLEHVLNPLLVLKETVRTLKKGGKIIGHVPTEYGDWGKQTIGVHPEHLRAYNRAELKNVLEKAGLKKIHISKRKLVGRRIADYYFFEANK